MLEESQNLNFAVPSVTLAAALSRARARDGTLAFPQNGDEKFSIGMLYVRGQGVPQDYAEAAKWIQQAADKGHAEAQTTIGAMFLLAKGEPQNDAQAAEWFRKAAEQGFPAAQFALGSLLSEGRGVPKSDAEAAIWWRRAAEKGDAAAQVNLGAAYQLGNGVPVDFSESYFWYKVGSTQENNGVTPQNLAELLKTVGSKLSPQALSSAAERARKWLADHPADE